MIPIEPKPLSEDEVKAVFKEAMREWLDERYTEVGKWTVRGFLAAVAVAMLWLVLVSNGWHKF